MRLGVASFFIETFKGMAERKQKANSDDEEATASEVIFSHAHLHSLIFFFK